MPKQKVLGSSYFLRAVFFLAFFLATFFFPLAFFLVIGLGLTPLDLAASEAPGFKLVALDEHTQYSLTR